MQNFMGIGVSQNFKLSRFIVQFEKGTPDKGN